MRLKINFSSSNSQGRHSVLISECFEAEMKSNYMNETSRFLHLILWNWICVKRWKMGKGFILLICLTFQLKMKPIFVSTEEHLIRLTAVYESEETKLSLQGSENGFERFMKHFEWITYIVRYQLLGFYNQFVSLLEIFSHENI